MLGTMAAMTPTGTPTSHIFSRGSSLNTPTVFIPRTADATFSDAKRFFVTLSSELPKPVSLTASSASSTAAAEKAFATASTILSSCSWLKDARSFWAFSAWPHSSRASCRAARSLSNSIYSLLSYLVKFQFVGMPPRAMRARCTAYRYCPSPLGIVPAEQGKFQFGGESPLTIRAPAGQ